MKGSLHIYDDVSALNKAVAQQWCNISTTAISKHNAFRVALAGGSTPRILYQYLAHPDFRDQVDWSRTHIYFGDERCVPIDHADSNYRMAYESLLSHVPIPEKNIFPMFDQNYSVEENTENYSALIASIPCFDLILLGMGDDGHTASLFPGTPILEETHKPVACQFVEKFSAWRISLTFPTINAADNVAVLVAGDGKANIMEAVVRGDENNAEFPIQRVNPQGKLDWYLDKAAARLLPGNTE